MDDDTSINKHFKDSTFSKPLGLGKMVPTCSLIALLNSLSSFSKIHVKWVPLSAILQESNSKINQPLKRKIGTAGNFQNPTTNSVGQCSIPDGKNESDTEGRQGEGYPVEVTLRNATIT